MYYAYILHSLARGTLIPTTRLIEGAKVGYLVEGFRASA
jgi:hypothetical protein